MQISKINTINSKPNFGARFSEKVEYQIKEGKQRFKSDKAAFSYYNDRVAEAKALQPKITIATANVDGSMVNPYGRDIIIFKRGSKTILKPLIEKSLDTTNIEAEDLRTLDGITALCENLRNI